MICHVCRAVPATERTNQLPAQTCDECLAAIGEIRVWMREGGRVDSIEKAIELRRFELRGKLVMR